MKVLVRNSIHVGEKSHDCLIAEIGNIKNGGKKVKFTYQAYNANESCSTEFFDGYKWNPILSMLDLGVQRETSAYVWNRDQRKQRADELFKKAETICNKLI